MPAHTYRGAALVLAAALGFTLFGAGAARATLPDSTFFNGLIGVRIAPAAPCRSDSIAVVFDELCPQDLIATHWERTDVSHARLVVHTKPYGQWLNAGCTHDTLAMLMEPHAAGSYTETVEVQVTVPSDSGFVGGVWVWHDALPYTVTDTCGPQPLPAPFTNRITIGSPICSTCPVAICPDEPLGVTVGGTFPNQCWAFTGTRVVADPSGGLPTIFVDIAQYSSSCAAIHSGYAQTVILPPWPPITPGVHTLSVVEVHHDALGAVTQTLLPILKAFTMPESCAASALVVPAIQQVTLRSTALNAGGACDTCPPTVCAGAPMRVTVSGVLPNTCWQYTYPTLDPSSNAATPVVTMAFQPPCADINCTVPGPTPFSVSVDIDPGVPAAHQLILHAHTNVLPCTPGVPSVDYGTLPVGYVVGGDCPIPPPPTCVASRLTAKVTHADSLASCDRTLVPGTNTTLAFAVVASAVPLAGLQGRITPGPGLHVVSLAPAGAASNMHLVTHALGDTSVAWVLFADQGAPVLPGKPVVVLDVLLHADSVQSVAKSWVSGRVTAGSDSLGNTVPACDNAEVGELAWICFAHPTSCDANGDGRIDVADLVRMASCWFRPATCPDTLMAWPDCNGDGAFHLDDILCCARTILGGGAQDSLVHPSSTLHVALGVPQDAGGLVTVPLQLTGANTLGGALLHVTYPADRYEALAPTVAVAQRAGRVLALASGSDPWLPLEELGAGDIVVGVLRLDTVAPDAVSVPLTFRLKPGATPGGTITVDRASLTGTDGSALGVNLSGTQATLPGAATAFTRIELLAGPNPSTGTTRFAIRLPRGGNVELALYDLAGRRVATLVHGKLGAGESVSTWEGAGVPSGTYFARLSVDGVVSARRVVMRLGH